MKGRTSGRISGVQQQIKQNAILEYIDGTLSVAVHCTPSQANDSALIVRLC